jgi:hypothetical protein
LCQHKTLGGRQRHVVRAGLRFMARRLSSDMGAMRRFAIVCDVD